MRLKLIYILFFCLIGFGQNLVLGLSPRYSKKEQLERFNLLTLFLKIKLDVEIELQYANSNEEFIENYISGKYDLAFSSSILFAQARIKKSKILPLAIVKNRERTFYKSILLVHKSSTINSISDLNGKSIAFGEKESTSRYLIPNYFLKTKNIEYGRTLYDKDASVSIDRLKNRDVDVIVIFQNGTIPNEFRILHESFKIPEYLFSVNTSRVDKKLEEQLFKTIVAAPVIMSKKLRNSYNGFAKTRMKNFNHLIDVARFYLNNNYSFSKEKE
jgi:phosphonate transport system substrate-binding protein